MIFSVEFKKKSKIPSRIKQCEDFQPFCTSNQITSNNGSYILRTDDFVQCIRPNFYKRNAHYGINVSLDEQIEYNERNIITYRNEHICNRKNEKENQLLRYNHKANRFFASSNSYMIQCMNSRLQKLFKIIFQTQSKSNIPLNRVPANHTSIVNLTSANKIDPSKISSTTSHFLNIKINSGYFQQKERSNKQISQKSTKNSRINKFYDVKELYTRNLYSEKRNKSNPVLHSRELVYERKIIGILFKQIYSHQINLNLKPLKSFYVKNLKKQFSKNKIQKNLSDIIKKKKKKKVNKNKLDVNISEFKLIENAKSVKSIKDENQEDSFILDIIPEDEYKDKFQKKKEINYCKRLYKCHQFTKKCFEMFHNYQEFKKKFEKEEIVQYKKVIEKFKKEKKDKELVKNLFEETFETKFNFLNKFRRLSQIQF